MKAKDKETIINAVCDHVAQAVRKNGDEIIRAYELLYEDGGLPISIGVKLQGNLDTVKTIYNITFPIEKFKETYKETLDIKQGKLFPTESQSIDLEGDGEPEDEPQAAAEGEAIALSFGKDIHYAVDPVTLTGEGGQDWTWNGSLSLPKGGEELSGAFEADAGPWETREEACIDALTFFVKQTNAGIELKAFAPSVKSRVQKAIKGLTAEIDRLSK